MELEEANKLVADELLSSDSDLVLWNSLSDEDKTKLIVKGTRLVDKLPFLGIKYKDEIELQWPRVLNNKEVECPTEIKIGLIRQVLRDLGNKDKQETKLQELGVKEYSIKNASIKFGDINNTKLCNNMYTDIYSEYFSRWTY
jgi:hypothetical protein